MKKTEIAINQTQALRRAKEHLLEEFESRFHQICDYGGAMRAERAWIVDDRASADCCCGETGAVDVTLFCKELGGKDRQLSAVVGYCRECGEDFYGVKYPDCDMADSRRRAIGRAAVEQFNSCPERYPIFKSAASGSVYTSYDGVSNLADWIAKSFENCKEKEEGETLKAFADAGISAFISFFEIASGDDEELRETENWIGQEVYDQLYIGSEYAF